MKLSHSAKFGKNVTRKKLFVITEDCLCNDKIHVMMIIAIVQN